MGSIGIVVGLILRQFLIDGSDRQGTLVERVELITAGAIGALHTARVQFPKLYWKQQLVKMACPVTG